MQLGQGVLSRANRSALRRHDRGAGVLPRVLAHGVVAAETWFEHMKIACGRCLLRPFDAADAESLAHHGNDHDVWKNLRDRFPHPYTLADAESYLAHVASHPVLTSFAIVVDDKAIGGISLMLGDDIARQSAEVGYWIGREFWGRGIMVDAVRAATVD